MTYTAEQLRRDAIAIERMHGETLTVEWRDHQAGLLRAFAAALEENARLKAAWDASHKQAMKNGAACNEWRDRAERAEAELAETRRDLQFIERWANHHGQKPNITPREVLSMIQHYPPILEITRSYEDGKVPDTPNPWAELAKLRAEANDDDALRERMANILTRTAAALKGEPGPLTLHDWSGLPEIAERAASDLAKLRQHAEAMAKELESIRDLDGWYFQSVTDLVRAFRADFPGEK